MTSIETIGSPRRLLAVKWRWADSERWMAFLLLLPTALILGVFAAYPFGEGIWLSLTDTRVGAHSRFVGLQNFALLWSDSIFRRAMCNTFVYAVVTTILKLSLGLWLAVLLNRDFRGKNFVRSTVLLPFIVPTVLSTYAWKWMFDPTFSVINWSLFHIGMISKRIAWLDDPNIAFLSIIVVNVWRGIPFYAISLLAGLQTIGPELAEAAAIDGANRWRRFVYITWPLLLPVTVLVTLFSLIQTFADFQLVYVLTGGGPTNSTQLLGTYAYQLGIGTGLLSLGAAISLSVFPVLFIVIVLQQIYVRKIEAN
ncbi:carbohydrate ABC transporter permease [Bradyrhizobium ottawaense]|uniref:carbohydrate ABC transporter permease n=1 Tax=Bradyrhizobium ottawaense TaxID=931866 RepID=UPI003833E1EB